MFYSRASAKTRGFSSPEPGGAWSVRTLRRIIGTGELPFYRRGRGKIVIKKDDLDRFLARCRCEGVDLDALANEVLAELGKKEVA